jgi:allantoicase
MTSETTAAPVPDAAAGASDLASRWVGGTVVAASDESFGEKEHLLDPWPCDWRPGRFGPRGELVDGWETRRRRTGPGEDWAIVRLGTPGVITAVDVDTTSFTGNHPATCRIEATAREGYPDERELRGPDTRWETLVETTAVGGNAHHLLPVSDDRRWTHVRLVAAPDGGVARLRIHGHALPDPRLVDGISVDLASWSTGGVVVTSSNDFYSSAQVVNRPDRARHMGEGWETQRRRSGDRDWLIIRLGYVGTVAQIVVDTSFYRYNASASVALHGSMTADEWTELLSPTALQPDTIHHFLPAPTAPVGFVKVEAFPDGGLSRVRVIGHVDPGARAQAGRRWWDALPEPHAAEILAALGLPTGDKPSVSEAPERLRSLLDGRR